MGWICEICESFIVGEQTPEAVQQHLRFRCDPRFLRQVDLEIGILSIDGTQSPSTVQGRLELFADAASRFNAQCESDERLFVAPEFFFFNSSPVEFEEIAPSASKGIFTEHDFATMRAQLQLLSHELPQILLAPGTMPWGCLLETAKVPAIEAYRTMPLAKKLPGGVSRDYLIEDMSAIRDQFGASRQRRGILYKNTLVACRNGNVLLTYTKQVPYWDDGDFEMHWFASELPIVSAPPVPEQVRNTCRAGSLRYGFEICIEHQYGLLRGYSSETSGVHVLTANTMEERFRDLYASRRGGIFVQADSNVRKCGVWTRSESDTPVEPVEAVEFRGAMLLRFNVRLDKIPIRFRAD